MNNQPYFSIVIPTYNRPDDLRRAVYCLLDQSFTDIEIIVCDNSPSPETATLTQSFNDSRISYFPNKINIGFIKNIEKGITVSKGKYIILQGDDDFMVDNACLNSLHDILIEKEVGFARLNFLSYAAKTKSLFKLDPLPSYDFSLPPHASHKKIVEFINAIDPFFISGLVFKASDIHNIPLIDSQWAPWLPLLFHSIEQTGGIFIPSYFYVATWMDLEKSENSIYKVRNGMISFENYQYETNRYISGDEYENFKMEQIDKMVSFLPAVAYFTGKQNTKLFAKRLLELSPKHASTIHYWFYYLVSLIAPQPLLLKGRDYLLKKRKAANAVHDSTLIKLCLHCHPVPRHGV